MQYMSIQMLNEYRTGWKKEVDTILEKYMECRDESIVKQKEQGLLEVRPTPKLKLTISDLRSLINDPIPTIFDKPSYTHDLDPRSQTHDPKPKISILNPSRK